MKKTPFDILKKNCHDACHERHACADGYRQMLASENVSQMMATWRNNWQDIVQSKFADIIEKRLPKLYPNIKDEMNASGIYLNECPDDARQFVKVIVTTTDTPIHIYGDAKAYIVGDAQVVVHDHAQVYNYRAKADVTLLDHSYGSLLKTDTVSVSPFAK